MRIGDRPEVGASSIAGGVTPLAYAIYRQDPVFVIGQLMGIFIYNRNIYIARERREHVQPGQAV